MPSFYKRGSIHVKECSACNKEYHALTEDEDIAYNMFRKNFSPRRNARDGLESSCYRCRAIAEMRIRFGIDVQEMLDGQDNTCAICKEPIQFNTGSNSVSACVDHDHETNETRGILCRHCNLGLGHFKDNIKLMEKAIEYLKAWKSERMRTETIGRDK